MTASNPYIDALKWAAKFESDSATPPAAFIYRRQKELVVIIPQETDYQIRTYKGTRVNKTQMRFVI